MGRARQPEIRERLLAACTDYALAHGLPERLEPLATAAGTSTRMLLYHFDTRDSLLREILRQARQRQRDTFSASLRPRPGVPYLTTLEQAWSTMTGVAGRPYLNMFGRLREDAEQQLWPGFRREATTDWLEPFAAGMASIGRPELATLILGVIRGLIMDLDATQDVARVDQAMKDFLALLTPGGVSARDENAQADPL